MNQSLDELEGELAQLELAAEKARAAADPVASSGSAFRRGLVRGSIVTALVVLIGLAGLAYVLANFRMPGG